MFIPDVRCALSDLRRLQRVSTEIACTSKQRAKGRRWRATRREASCTKERRTRKVPLQKKTTKKRERETWRNGRERQGTNYRNETEGEESAWEKYRGRNGTGRTAESRRREARTKGKRRKRKSEKRRKLLPFLAGQVHASILAMPAGIVQAQSRGAKSRHSAARLLREQKLSKASSFFWSLPSLARALATSSRRDDVLRFSTPLYFYKNYMTHRLTLLADVISVGFQRFSCDLIYPHS